MGDRKHGYGRRVRHHAGGASPRQRGRGNRPRQGLLHRGQEAGLLTAQCLVVAADMLLGEEGALARKVIAEAKPYFKSKEEYLAAIDRVSMTKDAVTYNEDGTVTLDFSK